MGRDVLLVVSKGFGNMAPSTCLIKNAASWGLWSRPEPEERRNHSGATTGPR
jgi:hypothetical protein